MRVRPRLRTTIIAWSFIPAVIILGCVALAHFLSFQLLTEDLVFERNRDFAVLLAHQYAGELHELAQPLQALATSFKSISDAPVRQQAALDASYERLWDFDAGVIVLSPRGQITAADMRRPELRGRDWSSQPFFQEIAQQQTLTVTNSVPAGLYGQDVVIMAVPVHDDQGTFKGAVAGMFAVGRAEARITTFYATIRKLAVDASGTVYIVDGAGRVIFHPEYANIGESHADQVAVARAQAGKTGTLRSAQVTGRKIIASYASVAGTPWSVIMEEDWDRLGAASTPYQRLLLALLALGLVVPAVVVALGVRRITHPVHELINATQAVTSGDFSRRIISRSSDEIDELADQFNRMASQLEESYATLEQRVAHRTRELAALNDIIRVASQSLDINQVLDATLEKTLEVTGMAVGAAFQFDAARRTLHLVAQRGLPQEFADYTGQLPLSASVASRVVATAPRPTLMLVEEYSDAEIKRILARQGVSLSLSIPLVSKERVLGFINLGSREVRDVPEEELALMASIGQQVGAAVENAQLYEQVEEAAAAAERSRLARELHDAVSQTLFSANMIAGVLPRLWKRDQEAARAQLAELYQLTRGAQAEMRILLLELRPDALIETALSDLMEQLGQATSSRAMVPVKVDVDEGCKPPLEVKVALYRIAQEALNNVIKHADANQVRLALTCEGGTITLIVCDDGQGFEIDKLSGERLGQRSMRERAEAIGAHFVVTSAVGKGTTVTCRWPATHPEQRASCPRSRAEER